MGEFHIEDGVEVVFLSGVRLGTTSPAEGLGEEFLVHKLCCAQWLMICWQLVSMFQISNQ